ncbi:hypothetical protein DCAR_0415029 [Daucus carota subsp. sativus]|uniref:Uncharacterized protein n=1 Tax=Daucus carota subsp. sativus TaxID=79200 RepID=A0A165A5K0_DAUCS|nr:hypothetical protein DCAR_0415029 [Daucus carota subsp. sativus]
MSFLLGILGCTESSSSARVNDKENVKEKDPSLSSNYKSKSKPSGSKAPIPVSNFPVNSRHSFL